MRTRRLLQLATIAALTMTVGVVGSVPPAGAGVPVTVVSGSFDVYDTDEEYIDTISFTGPSCDPPVTDLSWDASYFYLDVLLDRRVTFGGDTFRMEIAFFASGLHTSPDLWGWGSIGIYATPAIPGTCETVTGAGACEVDVAFLNVTGSLTSSLVALAGQSWQHVVTVTGAPADCGDLALADFGTADPVGIIAEI